MVSALVPSVFAFLAVTGVHPPCGSLEECVAAKRQELLTRGTVGIGFGYREEQTSGGIRAVLPVAVVGDDLPAARAGIRRDDKIVAIKGRPVPGGIAEVHRIFAGIRPGDVLELTLERDGKPKTYRLTAEKPTEQVVRGWLNRYMEENFSPEDYGRYLELSGQARGFPSPHSSPTPKRSG